MNKLSKYTCKKDNLTQILLVGDIQVKKDRDKLLNEANNLALPIVYTDPPWNPVIAKQFRKMAECKSLEVNFQELMNDFVKLLKSLKNLEFLIVEQSKKPSDQAFFFNAFDKFRPKGFANTWQSFDTFYQNKIPQAVHLFSTRYYKEDLKEIDGLKNLEVNKQLFTFLKTKYSSTNCWVLDCFMGQGITSRMCHNFGFNCLGFELGEKRLLKAITWLEKKGYTIEKN
jgi:hypothetical protein